ncbi:MAG TPA: hypothetical protein DCS93_00710 [Microscillaceae bacterium]|nr:hypothetical protein [Microscillaceae bacterium]
MWERNGGKSYKSFDKIPVRASICGFFFKKIVIHYECLSDDQIAVYEKLTLRKKEKLQNHLEELAELNEWTLRDAYLNEVEYLERTTYDDVSTKNQKQTLNISTYKHFKNDLINLAKEHISKIKQLLVK